MTKLENKIDQVKKMLELDKSAVVNLKAELEYRERRVFAGNILLNELQGLLEGDNNEEVLSQEEESG